MPGSPVRIGPFNDGLNNISTSGESKDTELVELVNFEVGPDMLLWSRPPFKAVAGTSIAGSTVDENWKILGVYRTTTTVWYLIVLKPLPAGASELQAVLMGDFTNTPIVIKSLTSGNTVAGFVQINAECFFVVTPSSSISGFKWNFGGSASDVTAMKKGNCVVAYKSRIWVAGINTADQSSRLYFSNVGTTGPDPTVWNTDDFFDVAPGEGGFITALLALNSSIIIFKNDGTWRFSYPASPKKGQVDKISGSVGAATATSVLEFENYIYVYDQGRVYELVNNNYTLLNRFVRFAEDPNAVDSLAPGVDLSILNRRLLVRYFNTMYAYSIDSRSWSQWRSYLGVPGRLYELPADSSSTLSSTYYGASAGTTQNVSDNVVPAFTSTQAVYMNTVVGANASVTHIGTTITLNTVGTGILAIGYLNSDSGSQNYNIRLSGAQQWNLTGNMTRVGTGTTVARMTYLLRSGATSVVDITITPGTLNSTFTAPDTAISAYLSIRHTSVGASESVSLNGIQLKRVAVDSPASIISVSDEYNDLPVTVEFIDCKMRTKSYDYQAPSSMKRLFWWGADIKTNRPMKAKLIPTAIKAPPTHAQLAAYTHDQLSAGTFGNPLSFLQTNLSIADGGDPTNAVTENGRIFVKLIKSMRFKQASFELELFTLGTKATGPAKVHTIVSYVNPKEKVVDKFN
jgi:hypothetical protein